MLLAFCASIAVSAGNGIEGGGRIGEGRWSVVSFELRMIRFGTFDTERDFQQWPLCCRTRARGTAGDKGYCNKSRMQNKGYLYYQRYIIGGNGFMGAFEDGPQSWICWLLIILYYRMAWRSQTDGCSDLRPEPDKYDTRRVGLRR